MTGKRWGRVGDAPLIGAGTYADNSSCAVSATGHGEFFIRWQVASDICARVKYTGVTLRAAADAVIQEVLVPEGGEGRGGCHRRRRKCCDGFQYRGDVPREH